MRALSIHLHQVQSHLFVPSSRSQLRSPPTSFSSFALLYIYSNPIQSSHHLYNVSTCSFRCLDRHSGLQLRTYSNVYNQSQNSCRFLHSLHDFILSLSHFIFISHFTFAHFVFLFILLLASIAKALRFINRSTIQSIKRGEKKKK